MQTLSFKFRKPVPVLYSIKAVEAVLTAILKGEKNVGKSQKWIDNNREKARNWNRACPEVVNERSKIWREENTEKDAAKSARYRARKKANTPADITVEELAAIKELSLKAKAISQETGVLHHVDHIIPLSKNGPHVLSNLQVLSGVQNSKKGTSIC